MNHRPDLSVFFTRARTYVAQGRMQDALDLYSDILKVDPDNAQAYADRGTARAMLQQFDGAAGDLERSLALGYEEPSAYTTLGTVQLQQQHFDAALASFAKAIELDPNHAFAYYNRSNVHYQLGDVDAAIADLGVCLELNPEPQVRQLIQQRLQFLHGEAR